MKTRYTVQYWFRDEHDALSCDCDTLKEAVKFASSLSKVMWKDILIYARHWQYINEPFESIITKGLMLDDYKWELIDDDFIQYYDTNGKLQSVNAK